MGLKDIIENLVQAEGRDKESLSELKSQLTESMKQIENLQDELREVRSNSKQLAIRESPELSNLKSSVKLGELQIRLEELKAENERLYNEVEVGKKVRREQQLQIDSLIKDHEDERKNFQLRELSRFQNELDLYKDKQTRFIRDVQNLQNSNQKLT
eukprot:UN26813